LPAGTGKKASPILKRKGEKERRGIILHIGKKNSLRLKEGKKEARPRTGKEEESSLVKRARSLAEARPSLMQEDKGEGKGS